MSHLRSWFLPIVAGSMLVAVLIGAMLNARTATPQPGHDHGPQRPLTLEEVKRKYNPDNSPYVTVVQNPDGTFTIDRGLPIEPVKE